MIRLIRMKWPEYSYKFSNAFCNPLAHLESSSRYQKRKEQSVESDEFLRVTNDEFNKAPRKISINHLVCENHFLQHGY